MFRSYRIGTIFGFPLEVNLSFLLMLGAVFLFMGGLAGVLITVLAFASVILHELGHALVARHLGVPVAGIELHFFGGAAKLAGQPRSASDEVAIAAAGPAVSFALGGLSLLLFSLTGLGVFQVLAWINLILGAFNLIPGLPMDGGRILRALLSKRLGFRRATDVSITIARGVSVTFGVLGVVVGSVQLVLLAVVLWVMGTAERAASRVMGYGQSLPRATRYANVEVMPRGFESPRSPRFGFHRPVRSAGFEIRRIDGRLYIVPIER